MIDTVHNAVEHFHNDGTDVFGFAKLQYTATDQDVVNIEVNRSRTRFAVPFDSVEGIIDDHQQDVNGYVNVGWRHQLGTEHLEHGKASELYIGTLFRDGSIEVTPR